MVAWTSLLLPVALSSLLVFIASCIIHMVLQLHKPDYRGLPNEEAVRAAVRDGAPGPGQYILPYCADPKQRSAPETTRKYEEGPVGVLYLRPPGAIRLGPFLAQWVGYTLVIGGLTAYVLHSTVASGAPYLTVFRVAGAVAWLAYAWQGPSDSIWKCKPWSVTARELLDGLVYASLTAGAFAWLWPGRAGA